MSLSHHLAAVWFADVVDYTRLSEENEGEAVRLVHGFQRVAREVVARHGGRIVKFLGDGALAEFSSTDMAVRSAEALIRAFAASSEAEGLASDKLRVGVHVGDVVATEDGDLYGDGVNVASRIQAAGDPGEVWVSEDVRRQLRQRPEFRFESRGERELKGLSRPLAMHAVEVMDAATWAVPPTGAPTVAGKLNGAPSGGPAAAARSWTRRRALSLLGIGILIAVVALGVSTWFLGGGPDAGESAVLAVLPFENLSGDEETEPFVLGVHDDLLTHLSRLGTFKVISRMTVMGYEGSTKSVPEIAQELGATTVLEGGVQRSGDRIRMNVQLIDARTDEHLWAERYDRTLTAGDVFAIQAEIAERIAGALATALTPEQRADLARAPTEDLEALDLYYQGLAYYHTRSTGGFGIESARRAETTLAAAVEADPQFAAAWAALAQARAWQLRLGVETDTTGTREALDRAAALAPEARETIVAEGVYLYYARADFGAAEDRFQEGLSRWPSDVELIGLRSLVMRRLGRWEEALELGERARAIDPRNPNILSDLGETLGLLRRYEEDERTLDQVLALNPRDGTVRFGKMLLLLEGRGDIPRARRFLEASADVLTPAGRARSAALISLYERDYEAGIAALEGQPVDSPTNAPFLLALLSHWAEREPETRVWADSLQRAADRKIDELESGLDPFVQRAENYALRGIAQALSGRPAEALRDGRRAMDLMPISRDAVDAPPVYVHIATVFLLAGDRDAAFRVLDTLASVPSELSVAKLRLNPVYDSLREDPRYAELLEKLEAAERSGSGTR